MARAGLGVIVDEVLLDGGAGQQRLAAALDGLDVLWVGVHCDPAVAAAREQARADRGRRHGGFTGPDRARGVRYDVVVDSTSASTDECAQAVLGCVSQR